MDPIVQRTNHKNSLKSLFISAVFHVMQDFDYEFLLGLSPISLSFYGYVAYHPYKSEKKTFYISPPIEKNTC